MAWGMSLLLVILGLVGGVLSGMLGIGGGIVMAPLLLYVPPVVSLGSFDMKAVSGLTMVQSLFASLAGVLVHRKFRHVHSRLAVVMGATVALSGFAGAVASSAVSSNAILATFAVLALVAAGLMILPGDAVDRDLTTTEVTFNPWMAVAIAMSVGLVGGLVGQSGAFILIPLLIRILGIPTRVAIGTSLAVVLCAASAGTVGKIAAGQVSFPAAAYLVFGAVTGARLGGHLAEQVNPKLLRHALGTLISASAIRMWFDVLR